MTKLYILCGLPFSGKTLLAKKLANKLGFLRIDLDDIKFELLGETIKDELVSPAEWDRVYQEMYKRIEEALSLGKTVVHDTGNFTKHERALVRNIGDKLGVEVKTIYVDIPKEVVKQRWLNNKLTKDRFDISKKSFKEAVAEMEPPTVEENVIVYDGKTDIDEWIKQNFN